MRMIAGRFGLRSSHRKQGVRVGVGDDAAVVRIGRTDVVLTTDAVVEGVDFDLRYFRWSDIGYKALSASVSDLYACGATPSAFLVTAGIPKGATEARIRQLLSGLAAAALVHHAPIVGGDLTRSPKLFLDVCAVGRLCGRFKPRGGARPGDRIFLSGPVGASRAALHLFRRRRRVPPLLSRLHLRPPADRAAGLRLASEPSVTAMMDVSDGLLIDLSRLCNASGVHAGIALNQIPIHPTTQSAFRSLGKDPMREAVIGGEDYVLLFTARPPVPRSMEQDYTCIGCIIGKRRSGGPIYNMERRTLATIPVKGFLHRFG